jgi:hypothetical protein
VPPAWELSERLRESRTRKTRGKHPWRRKSLRRSRPR